MFRIKLYPLKNTYITSKHKELTDENAKDIAKILETNTTIKILKLNYNKISDEGAVALAEALKKNTTLVSLDLSHNLISNRGFQAIADTLETNITLISIKVDGNNIDDVKITNLVEARLLRNIALIEIGPEIHNLEFGKNVEIEYFYELFQYMNQPNREGEYRPLIALEAYRMRLVRKLLEQNNNSDIIIKILKTPLRGDITEWPIANLLAGDLTPQQKIKLISAVRQELDELINSYPFLTVGSSSKLNMIIKMLSHSPEVIAYLQTTLTNVQEEKEAQEQAEYLKKYGNCPKRTELDYSLNILKNKSLEEMAFWLPECIASIHAEYINKYVEKVYPQVNIDKYLDCWNRFFDYKLDNTGQLSDGHKSLLYVELARFNQALMTQLHEPVSEKIKTLNAARCDSIQDALLNFKELPQELSTEKELSHSIQKARTCFFAHQLSNPVTSIGSTQGALFSTNPLHAKFFHAPWEPLKGRAPLLNPDHIFKL